MASRLSRRTVWIAIFCALVFGETFYVALDALDPASTEARATVWVAAHKTSLPVTLNAFERYPREYRKAIFAALTPEQKSGLMHERFNEALRPDSGLTVEQRAAVAKAALLLTPDSYRTTPSAELKAICDPKNNGLTRDQVARYFTVIDRSETPSLLTDFRASALRISEAVRGAVAPVLHAGIYHVPGYCNCTLDSYCPSCGFDQACTPGKLADGTALCTPFYEDCGCFQLFHCDDYCYPY